MAQQSSEKKERRDLYQEVTDRIIAHMEEGKVPWHKSWGVEYGLAKNYISGKTYRGINMFLLNLLAPYEVPYYLTWKQAKELGGKVKKGSKSEQVYFYNRYHKNAKGKTVSDKEAERLTKAGEEVKTITFLKYFNVFNVESIEGIDFDIPKLELRDNDIIEECEILLDSMPVKPSWESVDGNCAYYDPAKDHIRVPNRNRFDSSQEYYNTLFHEIVHWTGHGQRLGREGVAKPSGYGQDRYAEEELVAEIGASFLCAHTGIDRESLIRNNAAYIQGWLAKLKSDKKFIFRASKEAQKAADFIIGEEVLARAAATAQP